MSSILSSYTSIHNQIDDAAASTKGLSDKELEECLKILNAAPSTEESTRNLVAEVDSLGKYALSVDSIFARTAELLQKIASEAEGGFQEDVKSLASTWDKHRKSYADLLWKSRSIAGKAQVAADDFSGDFMNFLLDNDVTKDKKKSQIKNYINILDRYAQQGQVMRQAFSELHASLKQFMDDWKKAVEKHKLDIDITQITDLDRDISVLYITLVDLQKKVHKLASALGVLSSVKGVTEALTAICPGSMVDVMINAMQGGGDPGVDMLSKITSESKDLTQQIGSKTVQRVKLESQLKPDGTKAVHATLNSEDNNLGGVFEKLAVISSVWDTIREDLSIIEGLLDYADDGPSKMLFDLRLDTLKKLYTALGKALRQYQISVDPEHDMFKGLRG